LRLCLAGQSAKVRVIKLSNSTKYEFYETTNKELNKESKNENKFVISYRFVIRREKT
jgi:hypothetical protein